MIYLYMFVVAIVGDIAEYFGKEKTAKACQKIISDIIQSDETRT